MIKSLYYPSKLRHGKKQAAWPTYESCESANSSNSSNLYYEQFTKELWQKNNIDDMNREIKEIRNGPNDGITLNKNNVVTNIHKSNYQLVPRVHRHYTMGDTMQKFNDSFTEKSGRESFMFKY